LLIEKPGRINANVVLYFGAHEQLINHRVASNNHNNNNNNNNNKKQKKY